MSLQLNQAFDPVLRAVAMMPAWFTWELSTLEEGWRSLIRVHFVANSGTPLSNAM